MYVFTETEFPRDFEDEPLHEYKTEFFFHIQDRDGAGLIKGDDGSCVVDDHAKYGSEGGGGAELD